MVWWVRFGWSSRDIYMNMNGERTSHKPASGRRKIDSKQRAWEETALLALNTFYHRGRHECHDFETWDFRLAKPDILS